MMQTGKALRAAQRNGNDNLEDLAKALKARLPPTIYAFHATLDDIESEIASPEPRVIHIRFIAVSQEIFLRVPPLTRTIK